MAIAVIIGDAAYMNNWLLNTIHNSISQFPMLVKTRWNNVKSRLTNGRYISPDVIIRDSLRLFDHQNKAALIECSITEDAENSHYTGILNTLSNHCVGTIPIPVSLTDYDDLNDAIEDRWIEWGVINSIGSAIRDMRRTAAQTGLAVAIPHRKPNTDYEIKLGFKIVGQQHLKSPLFSNRSRNPLENRIVDGIEYWPNGDIRRVYILEDGNIEPTPYNVPNEAFVWSRKRAFPLWPECSSAFSVYPSIRRYLENVVRGEEMRSAMPMAVKLGPSYSPANKAIPRGAFPYEPGMVMTLPPDTELQGLNWGAMASDRAKFLDLMIATGARCIDMPLNLARASSSDSNMATAHIDLQPWKYVVDIDRFDYECFIRWVFNLWYGIVQYWPLMPSRALAVPRPPVLFNYTVLFDHPDPAKRASARSVDLISGASTLTRIYADQGLNARREIKKECKLLKISTAEFIQQLLASRSKQVAEVLYGTQTAASQGNQNNQEQLRSN